MRFHEKIGFSLLAGLLWFGLSPAWAQSAAPEVVGWVTSLTGKAYFLAQGQAPQKPLMVGQEIFNGMILITKETGAVRILFKGDDVLTLSPNTKITITQYLSSGSKTDSVLDLLWGRVRAAVVSQILSQRKDRFEVRTKNAVAGVRGSLFGVEYNPDKNQTIAGCGQGECYLTVDGKSVDIPLNQTLGATGKDLSEPQPLGKDGPGSYDPESEFESDQGKVDTLADSEGGPAEGGSETASTQPEMPSLDLDPLTMDNVPDGPGTLYENFNGVPSNVFTGIPGSNDCCGGGASTSGPGE